MKVLVVQIKHIGDAVATSMLFSRLKTLGENVETHYMVTASAKQAVLHNRDIDSFFVVDTGRLHSVRYVFDILKRVKAQKYDVVLDLYGKTIGNLLALSSKAEVRVGLKKRRSAWIYTHNINPKDFPRSSESMALRDRKLFLHALKLDSEDLKPTIELSAQEKLEATQLLSRAGLKPKNKLFMVSILGSAEDKSYPSEYMGRLLTSVVDTLPDVTLLVNYFPSQRSSVENILSFASKKARERVRLDLYADDLRGFLGLLSQCCGLFGNEGGAVNMAKALDVPTFAIYSPQVKLHAWSGEAERSQSHPAAHLSMYRADLLTVPLRKKDITRQRELYAKFEPELLADDLLFFVKKYGV